MRATSESNRLELKEGSRGRINQKSRAMLDKQKQAGQRQQHTECIRTQTHLALFCHVIIISSIPAERHTRQGCMEGRCSGPCEPGSSCALQYAYQCTMPSPSPSARPTTSIGTKGRSLVPTTGSPSCCCIQRAVMHSDGRIEALAHPHVYSTSWVSPASVGLPTWVPG